MGNSRDEDQVLKGRIDGLTAPKNFLSILSSATPDSEDQLDLDKIFPLS